MKNGKCTRSESVNTETFDFNDKVFSTLDEKSLKGVRKIFANHLKLLEPEVTFRGKQEETWYTVNQS